MTTNDNELELFDVEGMAERILKTLEGVDHDIAFTALVLALRRLAPVESSDTFFLQFIKEELRQMRRACVI